MKHKSVHTFRHFPALLFRGLRTLLDEVILTDIYPARETPIPGVSSRLIYDNLRPGIEKSLCKKEEIPGLLRTKQIEVLITLGAGDIDNYVPEIVNELTKGQENKEVSS